MEELDRKVEKAQIHLNQLNKRLKDVLTQVSRIVFIEYSNDILYKRDRIDRYPIFYHYRSLFLTTILYYLSISIYQSS